MSDCDIVIWLLLTLFLRIFFDLKYQKLLIPTRKQQPEMLNEEADTSIKLFLAVNSEISLSSNICITLILGGYSFKLISFNAAIASVIWLVIPSTLYMVCYWIFNVYVLEPVETNCTCIGAFTAILIRIFFSLSGAWPAETHRLTRSIGRLSQSINLHMMHVIITVGL